MVAEQIVDSRLYIRLDLSQAPLVNQAFANDSSNKAHFASQMLLYDTIVVPTIDFGIVPTLISWLGLSGFNSALDTGTIQFLRRHGMLAYAGGLGIQTIAIERGLNKSLEWWQEAMFGNNDFSLEMQLRSSCSTIPKRQQAAIIRVVLENTKHLSYSNEFFIKNIAQESYLDIIKSPQLLAMVKKHAKKRRDGSIDLERLEEVPPNKVRVLHQDGHLNDVADLVLRVAEINMEILMATQVNNADLFTSQGAEKFLAQKLVRAKVDNSLLSCFIRLLDLTNIPDIRPAVASGAITFHELWKLRQSKKARKFREWLRTVDLKDARFLEKAYVEMLGKSTLVDSLPIRGLRFAITTALGLLDPTLGLGTSIIDNFFLDKWLKGYSPKVFLDELQKLAIQKRH